MFIRLWQSVLARRAIFTTHWQVLIGATAGLAISLAFISAIGLSAAGPPIIAVNTGSASQILDVSSKRETPIRYGEREDVDIVHRRQKLPGAWHRGPIPFQSLLQSPRPAMPLFAIEPRLDPPPSFTKSAQIQKGGTLGEALASLGADGSESHSAIVALRKVFNLRRLHPSQAVNARVTVAPDAKKLTTLDSLSIVVDIDRVIVAERDPTGQFQARIVQKDLSHEYRRTTGTIEGSLFVAAQAAELPVPLIMELIRIYSWDVDFQREIQRGDRFEVLYDRYVDSDAPVSENAIKVGSIIYASLTLSGKKLELFRYRMADGGIDYFDSNGASVRKALLRTPIDGARLSSRYGARRHPILGYTKMHRGVDFAAQRGTPVMAAGNGVVDLAGRNGAYGKYVRIRHNGRYKTAYAHLQSYGRGIRSGARVNQGQIVGYVGSTGRSTGPHLHYPGQ